MSAVRFHIDRLAITLHGVSAQVAEAAVAGLAQELRRRLSGLQLGDLGLADLGVIAIQPIRAAKALDAAALRGLIADRVALGLVSGGAASETDDGGSA